MGERQEDFELVRAALRGDIQAYETLYRQHIGAIYGLVLRLVGGVVHIAEELTQEAFVRAWRSLSTFRFESAFSSWLYRLATNETLMYLRQHMNDSQHVSIQDEEIDIPVVINWSVDLVNDLTAGVATLPTQARIIFLLHDVEGWKHEEISISLGVAVGTCKAQLHRARGLLQKYLESFA